MDFSFFKQNGKFDWVLISLIIISLVFLTSFFSKMSKTPKTEFDKDKKQIEMATLNKICVDSGDLTECYDIPNSVYKIYLYSDDGSPEKPSTIIITRK